MNKIQGLPGELRCTVTVTRKVTGKVDTFEMIGHPDPEQLAALLAESKNDRMHGAAGAMTGRVGGVSNQSQTKE